MSAMCRIAALCFLLTVAAGHFRSRRSGIADQRLAEIEALLELSKHGRIIDPAMLGKRKRNSDSEDDDFPLDFFRIRLPARNEYARRRPDRLFREEDLSK